MRDLMIDLETLGTSPTSPIMTIGACFFDIDTGEIGPKFHEKIDVADALEHSRMSGATFKWWLQQSDDARSKAIQGKTSSLDALKKFAAFCRDPGNLTQLRPWGNGSTFDITMLESSFDRIAGSRVHPADRVRPPWRYWNVRDCRTIKDIGESAGFEWTEKREGTAHDALDDAIFQAHWTSFYWRSLTQRDATCKPFVAGSDDMIDLLG